MPALLIGVTVDKVHAHRLAVVAVHANDDIRPQLDALPGGIVMIHARHAPGQPAGMAQAGQPATGLTNDVIDLIAVACASLDDPEMTFIVLRRRYAGVAN